MPRARQPSSSRWPTPSSRPLKIGLALHRRGVLGSRFFISAMKARISSRAPGGRSWATPPGRMNAWFMRSPVISSNMSSTSSRSRKPIVITVSAPISMPPVAMADQVGGDAVELHEQDPHDLGLLRDVVLDVEQPLDAEHVGRLVVERRQVVHPGAERRALHPGAVLHVLLDAGVQVADAAAGLGHRLALELEDQPEHAVRRRVLRAHVDDDPLVGLLGDALGDLVPVLAGDREDPTLGGLVRPGVRCPAR